MLKRLWGSYGHFIFALVLVALNLIFNWLTKTMAPRYQMASSLDRFIPFSKVFIVPYLLWFAYIIVVPVYLGLKSKIQFIQFSTFVVLGQLVCMLFYFIYPNGQNLRPDVMSNDIFSRTILAIYKNNPFSYTAPSIHVLYSLAAYIGLMKSEPFNKKRIPSALSFIFMVISILSTLFIKQHTVTDIIFGLLLSALLYVLVYKLIPGRKNCNAVKSV